MDERKTARRNERLFAWWVLAALGLLLLGSAWPLWRQYVAYRRTTEDTVNSSRCFAGIGLLAHMLRCYVNEHGALPYALGQPEIADPFRIGLPQGLGTVYCPSYGGSSTTGGKDSGYRMFNLTSVAYDLVVRKLRRPDMSHGAIESYGLPLAWCAAPVHKGARNVVVLEYAALQTLPATDGMDNPFLVAYARTMTEEHFQETMRDVRSALADGAGKRGDCTVRLAP